MVSEYHGSHFVFRRPITLEIVAVRLPFYSPALIIVKQVCPTAELYCGVSYQFFDSSTKIPSGLLAYKA